MFEILVLKDSLGSEIYPDKINFWRTYNPSNQDVQHIKREVYQSGKYTKIPQEYLSWIDCFYQDKTPFLNYSGKAQYFSNDVYYKQLWESFPKLFNIKTNPQIKSFYLYSLEYGEGFRLLCFQWVKDWVLAAFSGMYFYDFQGTYANTTENAEILKATFSYSKQHFENCLNEHIKHAQETKSFWESILGAWKPLAGALLVTLGLVTGGTTITAGLPLLLNSFGEIANNLELQKNGDNWAFKTEGNGFELTTAGFQENNISTYLIIGAGLFLLFGLMNKKDGAKK